MLYMELTSQLIEAPKKGVIPDPELQFEVKTVKNTNIKGEPWKYLTIIIN